MLRYTLGLVVALLLTSTAFSFPYPRQRTFVKDPRHPDNAIIEALIFLETKVDPSEWYFYRFFHFYAVSKEDFPLELGKWKVNLCMASLGTVPVRPFPIDKEGLVWAVDRRETNWSSDAFHTVAVLDWSCTQPNIDPQLAEELRRAIGREVDKTTFHCEGLVPAHWFNREVEETDKHRDDPENIAYYNLLYSRERFGDDLDIDPEPKEPAEIPWKGGLWTGDDADKGKTFPPGAFKYLPKERMIPYLKAHAAWEVRQKTKKTDKKGKNGFVDRNFPRDADDFDTKWGVKASVDFLNAQKVFKVNGTVIAGYRNDPKNGSIVSYNDRANVFRNTPLGIAMDTKDFDVTNINAAKKNIANQPKEIAFGELEEDASEHIAQKPDDFPAWLLTGGAKQGRKRVEFGDPHIVRNSLDPHNVLVLTFASCVMCHYPSDVILAPSNNKLLNALKNQNNLFAKTKQDQLVIDQFFFDGKAARGGWAPKLEKWRAPFRESLSDVTTLVVGKEGWSGARLASVWIERRDWYDSPVTLDQACAELGYSKLVVMVACLVEGSIDAGNLFLNEEPGIPRPVWDGILGPRLALILAIGRDLEDPVTGTSIFQLMFPDYMYPRGNLYQKPFSRN